MIFLTSRVCRNKRVYSHNVSSSGIKKETWSDLQMSSVCSNSVHSQLSEPVQVILKIAASLVIPEMPQIILDRSKLQKLVQKNNLIWTCTKWFGHDQNVLDPSKAIRTIQNNFGLIERQGIRLEKRELTGKLSCLFDSKSLFTRC